VTDENANAHVRLTSSALRRESLFDVAFGSGL
jgi:hypothetical protein